MSDRFFLRALSGTQFKVQYLSDFQNVLKVHVPPPEPTQVPAGAILSNFSVTTTTGSITVNWGDFTSNNIASNTPITHQFYCPDDNSTTGFWTNINIGC
ncbi:MAG: hypothetical protein EBU90_19605 [Proteobacteria bacterium]|nr:hypothetical protein [Pseudomonadota bacterium]NBP16260.1 hypothetical protein [bacterium]